MRNPLFYFGPPVFIWDEINLRKIGAHRVREVEVEQSFEDPDSDIRRTARGTYAPKRERYVLIGQTESGRLLKVPFEVVDGRVRPVTAYDAGKRDHALYWGRR